MNLRFPIVAVTACLLASCAVPNEGAIRILDAKSLKASDGTSCEAEQLSVVAGSLDIAGRRAYVVQFTIESGLQQIKTTAGGADIADDSRNNFFVENVLLTYSAPGFSFEPESVPLHFVIAPQSDDNFLRVNLISDTAYSTLAAGLAVNSTVELNVQLQFRGALQSGQKMQTNTVTFPISVFRSAFTGCTSPQILRLNGPCGSGGGQDGAPLLCCTPDPVTGKCST